MRSLAFSLVVLTFAAAGALGMTRLKRKGTDWDREKIEYVKRATERERGSQRQCQDPTKSFTVMFTMMCTQLDCAQNAPKCMKAIEPPGDMCVFMDKCMAVNIFHASESMESDEPEPKVALGEPAPAKDINRERIDQKKQAMKVMTCVMEKSMKSVGLTYIPGKYKDNMLALLNVTVSTSPDLADLTKDAMLSAVDANVCAMPTAMTKKDETMQYMVCLMNVCASWMALQKTGTESPFS